MPVKSWNDSEKLTLLRTAIACFPGFKLNAGKVAEMWPGDDEHAKPSVRSIRDNYRSIMKHAEDLETMRQAMQEAAAMNEDEDGGAEIQSEVDAAPVSPKASSPKTPGSKSSVTTPLRRLSMKGKRSTTNKSSTGSKRKRHGKHYSSDEGATSATETTSGDETEIVSPTPIARKTLPVRKTRRTTMVGPANGHGGTDDEEADVGAKHHDTEGSDGEYDLAKERRAKAERKAKLARRARK